MDWKIIRNAGVSDRQMIFQFTQMQLRFFIWWKQNVKKKTHEFPGAQRVIVTDRFLSHCFCSFDFLESSPKFFSQGKLQELAPMPIHGNAYYDVIQPFLARCAKYVFGNSGSEKHTELRCNIHKVQSPRSVFCGNNPQIKLSFSKTCVPYTSTLRPMIQYA